MFNVHFFSLLLLICHRGALTIPELASLHSPSERCRTSCQSDRWVTHTHTQSCSIVALSSTAHLTPLLFKAGQKKQKRKGAARPQGRAVSNGREDGVNNTRLPTPCNGGPFTIWLVVTGYSIVLHCHHTLGTRDLARCCRQAYKLFTALDSMSTELLNMHQQASA